MIEARIDGLAVELMPAPTQPGLEQASRAGGSSQHVRQRTVILRKPPTSFAHSTDCAQGSSDCTAMLGDRWSRIGLTHGNHLLCQGQVVRQ